LTENGTLFLSLFGATKAQSYGFCQVQPKLEMKQINREETRETYDSIFISYMESMSRVRRKDHACRKRTLGWISMNSLKLEGGPSSATLKENEQEILLLIFNTCK